eukprot:TRINITY_DN2265_c0_g1_i5.p1 TRINITY_DN2265_c0_g1~~TRINITY_DN2265_c0_g1_i5.p1  ORF type:complete len:373 (-),score=67.26 TRINITY_DN2265_c0_g1_i5:68-1186(-)
MNLCQGPVRFLVERFGNQVVWVVLSGCVGPILTIIGIVFLVEAVEDTRSKLVAQYNTAIDNWNNQYRAQFVNASGFQFASANTTGVFTNTTASDSLNDSPKSGETFKSYVPYKFSSASTLPVAAGVYSYNFVIQDQANETLYNNSGLSTAYKSIVSVSCSTDEAKKYASSGGCKEVKCTNRGGSYSYTTNECTITKYASGFCFLVEASSNGWTQSGGGGCGFSSSNGIMRVDQSSPIYVIPGEVRSSKDPYVVAASLTSGSMNFGLTASQNNAIGTSLLVVGLVFVVAVILCFIGTTQCVTEWAVGRGYDAYVQMWRTDTPRMYSTRTSYQPRQVPPEPEAQMGASQPYAVPAPPPPGHEAHEQPPRPSINQ